jgi:penicillin amidase
MPQQADPERGFVVTANNRLAADDFPYPLSGTWSSGHRARRIRERIEAQPKWSLEDCRRLHYDARSGRAAACVPHLIELLADDVDPQIRQAVAWLRAWDYHVGMESVPAALFNVFFAHWCRGPWFQSDWGHTTTRTSAPPPRHPPPAKRPRNS